MTTTKRDPLRRIRPGEYENERWHVERMAEDDGIDDFRGGKVLHPFGYDYVPAVEYSWFVHNKATGDMHDAYPTLREARRFAERA